MAKSGKKKVTTSYAQRKTEQEALLKKQAEEKKRRKVIIITSICAAVVIIGVIIALVIINNNAAGSNPAESSITSTAADEGSVASEEASDKSSENEDSFDEGLTYTAEIDVKDYGMIKVKLDQQAAPITVRNFVELADSGFYNGLTFHRIMEDFMIQGGDPEGTGFGGSDKTIKGEFSSNGWDNPISHTRGTISMGKVSGENDSASSQFFIVQKDSTFLDGDYAAFGKVTEGMEVVDKIAEDAVPEDDNGSIPKDEQPIINSIKITRTA